MARVAFELRKPRSAWGEASLRAALLTLLAAWNLLLLAGLLGNLLGRRSALFLGFGAAALLLVATRPKSANPMRPDRWTLGAGALGIAGGYLSFPLWIALIHPLGTALGLESGAATPLGRSAAGWLSVLVLAPVFEELLYRERLLPPLRRTCGTAPAIVLTSLLFALPHLEPWALLGTFVVGLGLGTLMLAGGSVVACIGVHAGLNLAALLYGREIPLLHEPGLTWLPLPIFALLYGATRVAHTR